ncbi:MAG: hypothetical protein QF577_04415 [Phycisphaerae bacterium]|nr:hypothetical protein [Phycisphaerae bacterium]
MGRYSSHFQGFAPGSQFGVDQDNLGYVRGLNPGTVKDIEKDARFVQDVMTYYEERDGVSFQSAEEALEYYWNDRSWNNLNTVGIGKEWAQSKGMEEPQKARLSRLQRVYEMYPNFYEEGGKGMEGLWRNTKSVLLDPVNLIGFGSGAVAGRGVAFGARMVGQSAKEATRAGIKAGAKRGAVVEAGINAPIALGADVALQGRDIELGIQDEFDPLRAGISTVAGAGLGGAMGAGFGAMGAGLPYKFWKPKSERSATRRGIAEADVKLTDRAAAEEAEAAARAAEGRADLDEVDPERITLEEAETLLDNFEQLHLAHLADELDVGLDEAVDVVTKVQRGELANETARAAARIKVIKEWPKHRDAQEAQAAALEAKADERAVSARQRIIEQDEAHQSLAMALKRGDLEEAERVVRGTSGGPDEVELGGVPGFDEAPPAGGAAPSRGAAGAETPTGGPERGVETPEGPTERPEGGETESPVADDTGAPAPRGPEGDETGAKASDSGSEDLPDPTSKPAEAPLEEQLAAAKTQLDDLAVQNRKDYDRANYLRKKADAGTLTEPEAAEAGALTDSLDARKQALKDARANVKHISEQVKAKTDEIVTGAEPDHVKVETDEPPPVKTDDDAGGLPTDKGEAAVDTVVPPKVNAAQVVGADEAAAPPTFEDLVTELGGLTEKDIVLRLSDPDDGIGLSAKEVRAGLREAGQGEHGLGLTKSHKKVAKKAWIAKQLKIYQAKQALIDQVQETIEQGNERVVFMPEVFREILKARVGDDNYLQIHIVNEYDNFLDKNVPLFAANKLAEYDPADAGRLIEDIRKEFGSEIADRLVGDVQAVRSGEFDISKFDLTKAQQKIILTWQKKVVEELVKSGKPRPMALSLARLASISKIEAIKNKTMDAPDGGVRLRQEPGGHEGRTHIPAYQKIRARVNHLQRKMAEGDDLTATQSQMEGMNEAQELAVLLEQKAKIEAGELSLRPVAGQIQSILRPGRGKSATQYTYMYALYPRLAERDESGARIFDAAESARREIEDAAIASTTLRKAGTDEKTGLNITQKEQVAREVETARGKADRQISALEAKLAGLYDARPKEGKAAPEIEGAIKAKQAEIKKAREAKDKEKVAALTEEMKELRAARKPAKKDDQIEAEIKTTKDEIRAIDKAANDAEIGRLEALLEQRQLGEPTKGRPVTDIEKELAALKETAKTDYFKRKKAARKERKVERDFFKSREWQQLQKLWGDRFQHIKQSRIDATNAKQRKIVTKLREEFGDRFEVVYAKAKIAFLARAEDHIRWRKARGQDTKPLAEYERMWHEAWGDNTLDPVDDRVSHTEVAKEVVDNSHREQAQLSQEGQSRAAAATEFIRTGDKAKLQAAIEKARTSTSPPTDTKPRGKRTPRVIVHQGIEIDVENDLAYAPIRGTDDTINSTAVFFHAGGPEVATITKWKNGYLIESTDGDNVLFVKDRGKVKDRIPEVISEQIKAAAKAGRLALSRDVDETLSYPEPNWHETNTHRGADLEDASAPEPNSADIDSPDILATELRAISVPKGKQVAIQLLSGKFSGNVRRASDRQLDAGRTVGDVLGKATSQEYVIGYSDAGRISKGKIQSTFVPLDPGANFIKSEDVLSSMGSSTPKLSNHATGAAKSLKARLPVRVHELDQIPIKIEDMAALPSFRRLDPAQFDKFETAADIHNWVMDMENTTWKMFGDDNASQLFATHIAKIQAGYEALAHYAPDGIKYPNASRRQAMRAVADLFNGEDITELSFITDALRRISGREGRKLPHLNQGETETPFFRQPRGQKGGNQITLTESAHVGTPKSVDLLHELGHWGYLNILTPEERLQFWNAMEKYVAKNGPDFTSLAKRLPGADPAAELSSPAEFFANQFAQFYVGSTSGLHWAEMKGIWSRMAETLNHIIDKYVLGINNDYVDPELRPLFERIAPYLDADGSGIQPNRFDEVYRAYAWRFRRMSEGRQQASPDPNQVNVEMAAKLLYDSEEFRMAIESSIDSANPMRMEQALHNGAARFKGLINSLIPRSHAGICLLTGWPTCISPHGFSWFNLGSARVCSIVAKICNGI